jgi:hypothetical protein
MLVDRRHPLYERVVLKDVLGRAIATAHSWDTETEEAVILLTHRINYVVIETDDNVLHMMYHGRMGYKMVRARLPGCRLFDIKTGDEIEGQSI